MSTFQHETFPPMHGEEDSTERFAARIRAARTSLGWTRQQLATASRLPHRTIARIELADGRFRKSTLTAVRSAVGAAGVIFVLDDDAIDGTSLSSVTFLGLRPRNTRDVTVSRSVDGAIQSSRR